MRGFQYSVVGVLVGGALFFGSGCKRSSHPEAVKVRPHAPEPVLVKTAPATPIQTKRLELGGPTWNHEWDVLIERHLPPAMLSRRVPHDVRRFCPAFFRMGVTDKRAFWAYFFQALAGAESGLDTKTNVRHESMGPGKDGVTGSLVRSQGLLQLTYEDKDRYGCNFDWKHDRHLALTSSRRTILRPRNNLLCGIRILDQQLFSRREPFAYEALVLVDTAPGYGEL